MALPIFVYVMQKNEGLLLDSFISYYVQLVDPSSICITDNFSDDECTLEVLERAKSLGIEVLTDIDFSEKGSHWIAWCKRKSIRGIYFALDADEFLTVDTPEVNTTEVKRILNELSVEAALWTESTVIRNNRNFVNKIESSDEFFLRSLIEPWFEKAIFVGDPEEMKTVDSGYHFLYTKNNVRRYYEKLLSVEFHNRPLEQQQLKARMLLENRLRSEDIEKLNDETFLRAYKGPSNHKVQYFLIKDALEYARSVDRYPTGFRQSGWSRVRKSIGFEHTLKIEELYISNIMEHKISVQRLCKTERCLIVLIEGREYDARLQKAYNSIREAKPDWPCVVLYRGPLELGSSADNVVHVQDLPKIPDIKTYSKILTHEKFYEAFSPFEFVLITQSDTAMAKCPTKPFEDFFKYDYSGAVLWRKYVGNGGFSLRNRRACLEVCRKNPRYSKDEDELFCKEITNKCPIEEASYFSVESRYFNHESNSFSGVRWPHFFSPKVIPCGMHRMNEYFPEEFMILQLLDSGFASYSSYDD